METNNKHRDGTYLSSTSVNALRLPRHTPERTSIDATRVVMIHIIIFSISDFNVVQTTSRTHVFCNTINSVSIVPGNVGNKIFFLWIIGPPRL